MNPPKTIYTTGVMTNDGLDEFGFYHRSPNALMNRETEYRLAGVCEWRKSDYVKPASLESWYYTSCKKERVVRGNYCPNCGNRIKFIGGDT